MTVVAAAFVGLLIGSLPTADWLAHSRGIDLRASGTGNPGTNNALRSGGPTLAVAVLVTELAKGVLAVWLGHAVGDSAGAALAGAGATAANVYNPWYRFQGGKGLAITAGTVGAAWPPLLIALLGSIGLGVTMLRRSGPAALLAFAIYVGVAVWGDLPGRGLVDDPGWMVVMALAQCAVMFPKHLADTLKPASPLRSRE